MKPYRNEFKVYNTDDVIESDCNSIAFKNDGTANAVINGITITTGNSVSIDGNANEIDRTIYNLSFGTGTAQLTVIRKLY